MKTSLCLVIALLFCTPNLSRATELANYIEQFKEADAKIQSIDSSTSCTNYLTWMKQAIDAQDELNCPREIEPWLKQLATTHSNNWKVLHATGAAALNSHWVNRWEAVQNMDRAYRLIEKFVTQPEERTQFIEDYVSLLTQCGMDDLSEKTPGSPKTKDTHRPFNNRALGMRLFHLPNSYDAASSDGEIIRWLIQQKPTERYTSTDVGRPHWTQEDFSLLLAGSHNNLPKADRSKIRTYNRIPSAKVQAIHSKLRDTETVVWGKDEDDYKIVKLPIDHQFISAYKKRAAHGDKEAAETLGKIFINRCQRDKAARYFEMAGNTEKVLSIRSKQGVFLPLTTQTHSLPFSVNYCFRNGDEAQFELSSLECGTNLLPRLMSGEVMASELQLLSCRPELFQSPENKHPNSMPEKIVKTWTESLAPLRYHKDSVKKIAMPQLAPGIYCLRANMAGQESELMIYIGDTVLYSAHNSDWHILCDPLTGQPYANEVCHFLDVSEGTKRENEKTIDGPHILDKYHRRNTDNAGLLEYKKNSANWMTRVFKESNPAIVLRATELELSVDSNYADIEDYYWSSEPFLTTDRPIYRPGEKGYLKVWHPDAFVAGDIVIKHARTDKQFPLITESITCPSGDALIDQFGGASYSFQIPPDAPLGVYRYESDGKYHGRFSVEEYRAPDFRVDSKISPDGKLTVTAQHAYGEPVTNGAIDMHLSFTKRPKTLYYPEADLDVLWGKGYWWNGNQFEIKAQEYDDPYSYWDESDYLSCSGNFKARLDSKGQAIFDLSNITNGLKAVKTAGYFDLRATISDATGKHFTDEFPVQTPAAIGPDLCCWLDKAFFQTDESIPCNIAFNNQSMPLRLEIRNITTSSDKIVQRIPISKEGETSLNALPTGIYSATLKSKKGDESQPFQFAVIDGQTTDLTSDNPLRLVVEKGQYTVDEKATLLIQVDQPGRYIYWFQEASGSDGFSKPELIHMDSTTQTVELPLTKAGILQSAAFTIVNGKPHLVGCTIPVTEAELSTGAIEISTTKKVYQPSEQVSLSIKTTNKQGEAAPCSVTISVYNKMLDQLTPYTGQKITDALFQSWINCSDHILQLEAPYTDLIFSATPDWIMKDLLPDGSNPLPQYLSDSDNSLFGGIGGYSLQEPSALSQVTFSRSFIRKDFRDLAYWNATVETDSNGWAQVSFPMPDGMTEWKVKVWAMHQTYAAEAETSIICTKDFIVEPNLPRFMIEGDQVEMTSSIRNYTTNSLDCFASIKSSQDTVVTSVEKNLKVNDLAPNQEQTTYWTLYAKQAGTADITLSAQSKSSADGVNKTFPVLPHAMLKKGGHSGILSADKTTASFDIVIPEQVDPESMKLNVHTSSDLLEPLTAALPYLTEYPHGCTEQTINRFLPSLAVMQTMRKLGIDSLTDTASMPADRKAILDPDEIIKRAQAGIDRLEAVRTYDGWGWNMRRDYSNIDELVTGWVLRGLCFANHVPELEIDSDDLESVFHSISSDMEDQAKEHALAPDKASFSDTDAFLCMVLSEILTDEKIGTEIRNIHKARALSFTDHLIEHADELSLYGKILLAHACDLQNKPNQRDNLLRFIEQYLEHDSSTGIYKLRTQSDKFWHWYNDQIEINAWYLKLLNKLKPSSQKTAGLARFLMNNRRYGDHWKSTRDTALCIEVLSEFAANNRTTTTPQNAVVHLNGQSIKADSTTQLTPGTNTLTFSCAEDSLLFYDATWEYYSFEAPITSESCDLVSVERTYNRVDTNNEGKTIKTPVQPDDAIKTGEIVEVSVTINTTQPLEYLLLEDFKPAGFENLDISSGYARGAYRELHDERTSFYISSLKKGSTTFTYRLRAELAGKVSALPSQIHLMYNPEQAANTHEDKLQVIRE